MELFVVLQKGWHPENCSLNWFHSVHVPAKCCACCLLFIDYLCLLCCAACFLGLLCQTSPYAYCAYKTGRLSAPCIIFGRENSLCLFFWGSDTIKGGDEFHAEMCLLVKSAVVKKTRSVERKIIGGKLSPSQRGPKFWIC